MKKFGFIKLVAMLLTLTLLLSACGAKGSAPSDASGSKTPADPAVVADAMMATFTPRGEMPAMDEAVVDNFYSFDKALISSCKIYASTVYTAEEIAVFSTVGEGAVEAAKKAISTRVDDLKTNFDGYKAEELLVVTENAKVLEGNGVVCLLVGDSENVAAAEKAFNEATK